jgi:hypothetical protein
MRGVFFWLGLLSLACASARAEDAKKLIDISGTYSDAGTTMQASENAPSGNVSLSLLLARVIVPDAHRAATAKGGVVKIAQNGDAALEIQGMPVPDARGGIVERWTKADGLKVEELQLVVALTPPKKRSDGEDRKIDGTYSFFLDETKQRLVVMVDFVVTKLKARPPTSYEKGIYIFPRTDAAK